MKIQTLQEDRRAHFLIMRFTQTQCLIPTNSLQVHGQTLKAKRFIAPGGRMHHSTRRNMTMANNAVGVRFMRSSTPIGGYAAFGNRHIIWKQFLSISHAQRRCRKDGTLTASTKVKNSVVVPDSCFRPPVLNAAACLWQQRRRRLPIEHSRRESCHPRLRR